MYLARTPCQNPLPSSSPFSTYHQSPVDRWTTESLVSGWRRYGNLIKNATSSSAGGLQTPPYNDDDMGTTYQVPNLTPSYEQHRSYSPSTLPALSSCSVASQRPPRDLAHMFNNSESLCSYPDSQSLYLPNPQQRSTATSSTSSNAGSAQRGYVQQHQQYQPRQPSSPRQEYQHKYIAQQQQQYQTRQPSSQRSSRRPSPSPLKREQEISARDAAMALHSLKIPSCVSHKGGSLSDFVADLTALFWFESLTLLEQAAAFDARRPGASVQRIEGPAIACPNFKKWVHNLLATTQVTQNVILLSLLFIHRLKVLNPKMHGLPGSEYRLLTVALMLANKFLDDNTYTNKTWSEVSQLSVKEIHVMEVEFLGNMRYSLLVTEKQWEEWLVKLARFHDYLERARQLSSPAALLVPSPSALPVSALPSPATIQHFPSPLQPTLAGQSPSASFYAKQSSGQGWPSHTANQPQIWNPTSTPLNRKRSMPEFDGQEPPAKRRTPLKPYASSETLYPTVTAPQTLSNSRDFACAPLPSTSEMASKQARLSVSNLTLNTTQSSTPNTLPGEVYSRASYAPESMISLPPILLPAPGMASGYLNSTSTAAPIPSILPTSGSGVTKSTTVPTSTSALPPSQYSLPSNRLQSQHGLTSNGAYLGSSPIGEPLTHTPMSSSPSNIYLQQRTSPYRPVRHAETLLHPPPSAFLQQYHLPNPIPPTQLHYQPLGRRNEVRTGIVPEFAMANNAMTMTGSGRYQEPIPAFRQSFSLPLRDLPPTTSTYSQQPRR
ncbi:hypothetical protein B0T20DRAFT_155861 [Sordaria brevicollis]|uniref:Cyclin n=1 Tax=Sordaria brevicollis TaxID=83679 RepID=A0AAE0PJ50_SORBR|nr:hypothetical protein B0T20DRAFT_155861 [Sordaria brevicollis]